MLIENNKKLNANEILMKWNEIDVKCEWHEI